MMIQGDVIVILIGTIVTKYSLVKIYFQEYTVARIFMSNQEA